MVFQGNLNMTKVYIVRGIENDKYFLYINELGMGELDKTLAERFIKKYPHVKPVRVDDAEQWEYTNP